MALNCFMLYSYIYDVGYFRTLPPPPYFILCENKPRLLQYLQVLYDSVGMSDFEKLL